MTWNFGHDRRARRPNLTPMIDVVFLLLVFFMLAARFGAEAVLGVSGAGAGDAGWSGPPRLVDITPAGLALNGVPVGDGALTQALLALMAGPQDPVLLRGRDGATLQQTVAVIERLQAAGFGRVILAE